MIAIPSAKLAVTWKAGAVPPIDPNNPEFVLNLGNPPVRIRGKLTPKAARKLGAHKGGAKLEGRLLVEAGQLVLADAGVQLFDPPQAAPEPAPAFSSPPEGPAIPAPPAAAVVPVCSNSGPLHDRLRTAVKPRGDRLI